MMDQEHANVIAAKLTGELFVGARVRAITAFMRGCTGVIVASREDYVPTNGYKAWHVEWDDVLGVIDVQGTNPWYDNELEVW